MKTNIKILLIIIIWGTSILVKAQSCVIKSEKLIEEGSSLNYPCVDYSARDKITLKPGFSFSANIQGKPKIVRLTWSYGSAYLNWTPSVTINSSPFTGTLALTQTDYYLFYSCVADLAYRLSSSLGSSWSINTSSPNVTTQQVTIEISYNGNFNISSGNFSTVSEIQSFVPSNWTFNAKINESLVFDADYIPTNQIPDANNRTLTKGSVPVGSISGSFNVSPSGAATYTIPIPVSPGTAKMEPQISIAYNSQGRNGLLGIGWDISGLSSISRVPQSVYTDGKAGSVNLDYNDRYALDGNRLLVNTGYSYGAENSAYETQEKTFSKIESFGKSGNGPQYFLITTKDGKVLEYGRANNSSSSINNTIYIWRLNKITDSNGNYIEYFYNTVDRGETAIDHIDYTGNVNSGLKPYNRIQFNYDNKTDDKNVIYIAGAAVDQKLLLREIKTFCEGKMVKKFSFGYKNNNFTYLMKITESVADNTEFNPTLISWGEESDPYNNDKDHNFFDQKRVFNGDFDGDGKTDWFAVPAIYDRDYSTSDMWTLHLNISNDNYYYFPQVATGNLDDRFLPGLTQVIDVNSDGKDDIIMANIFAQNTLNGSKDYFGYSVYLSTGNGFVKNELPVFNSPAMYSQYESSLFTEDFDGDGKNECLLKYNNIENGVNWRLFKWDYYESQVASGTLNTWGDKQLIIDFDGDGMKEILVSNTSGSSIYKVSSSGLTCVYSGVFPASNQIFYPADFNGDGKTDFLTFTPNTKTWKISYSTGKSYYTEISANPITRTKDPDADEGNDNYMIGDYNGDGKSDILEYYHVWNNNGSLSRFVNIYYSKGLSFYKESNDAGNLDWILTGKSLYDKFIDINGDGITDLVCFRTGSTDNIITFHPNEKKNFVSTISNGLNLNTKIKYKTLSEFINPYNSGTSSSFPLQKVQAPLNVVSEVDMPNASGDDISTEYTYTGATIHRQGLGFLGFESIVSYNKTTRYITTVTNNFNNTNYRLDSQITEVNRNSGISYSSISYTHQKIGNAWFSYPSTLVETNHLTGNTVTTTSNYNGDTNGNIYSVTKDYGGGFSETTLFEDYVAVGSSNIPGVPRKVTVKRKHPDDSNYFISKTYTTFDSNGNVLSKKDNYEVTGKEVETTYGNYNAYGQPQTITVTPSGIPATSTTYVYEPKGRYLLSETNPLLGTKSYQYEPVHGNPISETGITNITTSYAYDSWGNVTEKVLPDGNKATNSIAWAPENNTIKALYYTYSTTTGKPWAKKWYDRLGRVIREETIGYNNLSVYTDITYKINGDVEKKTTYTGSTKTSEVTYGYDTKDGRLISETYLNGKVVSYSYNNNEVSTTTDGKTYKKEYNKWGAVLKVTEPSPGGTISYKYYSNGKSSEIKTAVSTIKMTYDTVGNQETLVDPNAGTISYTYDALGRLTYQKDGRGNEDWTYYDALGRIDYKKNKNDQRTTYEYYTDGDSKGLLKKEKAANDSYMEYAYDRYGRMTKSTQHIDATINDVIFQYHFDSYGNMDQVTYPGGDIISQSYDGYGNLKSVSKGNTAIWTLNNMDATSMKYTLGNGFVTEKLFTSNGFLSSITTNKGSVNAQMNYYDFNPVNGLLVSREDRRTDYKLKESFKYDDLYRLTDWEISKNGTVTASYSQRYKTDQSGNIDVKTGVGTYGYQPARPNAIDALLPDALYTGSQINQAVNYTDFNKISDITQNNYKLQFTYGPTHERIKTELKYNNALTCTNYYAGQYEKKVIAGGNTIEYLYIPAGDGTVAVLIKTNGNSGVLHYLHKDHLGSIVCITGEDGNIKEQFNYDPWGRRRNPADWSFSNVPAPTILTRGFTGHEHMEEFALINMNGRVYDPALGMFISPDNYLQAPDFTQNFNRYTYCMNNPLMYTDPSGDFFWFAVFLGAIINTAVQGASGHLQSMGDFFKAVGVGALAGAAGAGVGTGVTAAMSGSTFGAGFLGTQSAMSAISSNFISSFSSSALVGAASGASAGFVSGFGNGLMNGQSFGNALLSGVKGGVVGGVSGGLLGGVVGGINALSEGRTFWDGHINLSGDDYNYLLACNENSSVIPNSPGQIDYLTTSKAARTVHMYKWMRYSNTYGDGTVNIDRAFSNFTVNDAGGMNQGFSSGIVKMKLGNQIFKTNLDFYMTELYGKYNPIVDFGGGENVTRTIMNEPWVFWKNTGFQFGAQYDYFELLYKWLNY